MKKLFLVLMLCSGLLSNAAMAYNMLQIDIVGGTYDGDTTITADSTFTLVALLNPYSGLFDSFENNDFYLTAALVPTQTTDPGLVPTIASHNATIAEGEYGKPHNDWSVLPSHGIFQTWYWQYQFRFDIDNKVGQWDVADDLDYIPVQQNSVDPFFYAAYFDVDVSGLRSAGYEVHFDLYMPKPDGSIIKAPFSHDAQSSPVPEPATMLLLGSGLIGMAGIGRKKFKK